MQTPTLGQYGGQQLSSLGKNSRTVMNVSENFVHMQIETEGGRVDSDDSDKAYKDSNP